MSKDNSLVICDMDGTLVNTFNMNFESYKEVFKDQLGLSITESDYRAFYGDYYENVITKILNTYNISYTDELIYSIESRKQEIYHKFSNNVILNNELVSIIKSLKDNNYLLSVYTSATKKDTQYILESAGIYKLFDKILTVEEVKSRKPNIEGFNSLAEHFGVYPCKTIVFEDTDATIANLSQAGFVCFKIVSF